MTRPSVVIVGGGVMGASAAWHLAARGWRDVLLLEREAGPGRGSTGAATGGFRAQFGTAINVRLSLLAQEKLQRFEEETGVDPGYRTAGYLWLAATEGEMGALRVGREIQHAEGLLEATEVSVDDVGRLNPAVAPEGVIGGAFCPTDGFIRPMRLVEGYLSAAERLGVRVEYGVEVTGLDRETGGRGDRGIGGPITAVRTSQGAIPTGAVVNAAGPWAARLAEWVGVELPVVPLRRQVAVTAPCDLLPENMPMTIFCGDGFHLRVRDGRILLLWPTPGVPGDPFNNRLEPEWLDAVVVKAKTRVPVLRQVAVDRAACYAGLYEMSPDKHALLGAAPGCENLFLINGSSGHGVMHAPALGQLLAEIMSDGVASGLDVTPLRPSRFLEGKPNPVPDLL
ncbi:MAG: NAD(P)/FAD-dependent oxidoreductase [Gemmatimonadales bacterium]